MGRDTIESAVTRPRVVYWNNIPSPYAVARLNAVVARANIALEVWFCSRNEPDRSWPVNESEFRFPWRYLPGGRVHVPGFGDHYFNLPVGLLSRRRPDLLVSLYAEPTFLAGWSAARTAGVRVAFRYLPSVDHGESRSALKEQVKHRLFTHTDGFKTSGPAGHSALEAYGVDPARIHTVTQSIDVGHWERGRELWRPLRGRLREQYGAAGTAYLYVGRLVRGKGVDDLLAAYRQVAGLDSSLLIAGDGVDEPEFRSRADALGIGSVQFLGFIDHDELPRVYAAADALVFPTHGDKFGLVVEEAMASGLPVISSEAASDIALRVPEGVAGFVVPPGDPIVLADRMRMIAVDPGSTRRMGEAAAAIAGTRGHDRYADDFERFVERVLTLPRARGQSDAPSRARANRPSSRIGTMPRRDMWTAVSDDEVMLALRSLG